MTHSFSAPWNGYGGSQSKPPTPRPQQRSGVRSNGRPSMQDAVRVSAPQNIDGDFSEDDYELCVDEDTLKRVYSYQPTPYWAGRLSSQLDRLAAEYPGETKMWRVERAINNLNTNAYGEGAKHSLDDFKEVFGKRVRNGVEW
ncbi:hypothetical protein Q9L58_002355 [Maublancomyces gigas]|uniref:Uncharacterized protein n=1 Tax=Discina gigas TaxID=1032678 RepID=A0ABR3GRT0_9PEZI